MSNFDPDQFLQTETEAKLETEYTPIPEGEYMGVIKKLDSNVTPNGSPVLAVTWIIDDQEVRDFTGMPEPTCRQSVWLDVNDNGALEAGSNKNVQLGRLRDALGQNDGKPWAPSMMEGQVARVIVKHTPDKNNPGAVFANVVQAGKA